MLPPRKWLWSLGLLAAAPIAASAGPLDLFRPRSDAATTAPAASNQEVAEKIAGALRGARLVGRDIDIEYKNGVARLTGEIADESQRAAATRIVSTVPGVQSVENGLTVMAGAPRSFSDSPIQQAAFEGSPFGGIQQVEFDTPAAGTTSPTEEQLFGGGTLPSQSFPTTTPEAYPQAGTTITENQYMAQRIAEAIQASGLSNYDLEVRFADGTCTLRGAVDDRSQAIDANEAAAKVPGVATVINQLTVRGRAVSVTNRGTGAEPLAQFSPYPSPQAAQLAWQQQMQQQQGGPQLAQYGQPGVQPAAHNYHNIAGGPQGAPVGAYPGPQGGYPAPQMAMGGPGGGYPGAGPHQMYNRPNLPDYAWPAYAPNNNYAAVSYPSQYEASAWPYIGPFYPYPQVPLEWRSAQLVWDDGYWNLKFNSKTDRWWWFMNPENWH
jgi:osmotically-inducible protein OsmY